MYSHSNCEFSENRLLNCHYHVMDTLWLGVRWSDNHSDTVHSVGIIFAFLLLYKQKTVSESHWSRCITLHLQYLFITFPRRNCSFLTFFLGTSITILEWSVTEYTK